MIFRHIPPSPRFTLIEVVVALAILSLSLAGLLQMALNSTQQIGGAMEQWKNEHMLAQAAEYLMLQSEDNVEIPEEFFPYREYSVETVCDDPEGLPEDYNDLEGQLPLRRWNISVIRNSDGKKTAEVNIDRLGYDYQKN